MRVSEDGVARTEFRGRRCARSQPLQTATADRTPDNYAGRKEHTEDTEEVRIYETVITVITVINPSALYERYVDLLTHMCESARME